MIHGHRFDPEHPRTAAIGGEQGFVDLDGEQAHVDGIGRVRHDAWGQMGEGVVATFGIVAVVAAHFNDVRLTEFVEDRFATRLVAFWGDLVTPTVGATDRLGRRDGPLGGRIE